MAEIQANLQSPLSCLVEDGDCRCHHDLGIPCDGSNFFLHSVRRNAVLSLHFEPKPKSSKTLQSLLMRLVIFVNTALQLNLCVQVKAGRINQSRSIWCHLACQCHVWSLKQAEEVCVYLQDQRNHNNPSHKSSSSIIGPLFYSAEFEIVFFLNYVGWIVNFVIWRKSTKGINSRKSSRRE